MPRYKVYYAGFYIVDSDSAAEAEEMKDEAIYDEYETSFVAEMHEDEMFI